VRFRAGRRPNTGIRSPTKNTWREAGPGGGRTPGSVLRRRTPGGRRDRDPFSDEERRVAGGAERQAGPGGEECVSEAACKPSSVPPAPRRRRGWPSIWGRRLPDGSCGRPEGWAARLSPGEPGCALLLGLAPGGVCRVSLRAAARATGRHRHCGTGPRLTADGRYPPPCAGELGLSSRRLVAQPARDHPATSLTDRFYSRSPIGPFSRPSGPRTRPARPASSREASPGRPQAGPANRGSPGTSPPALRRDRGIRSR